MVTATGKAVQKKLPLTGGRAVNGEYFPGRLKELREAAKLTQAELAKLAGTTQQAIAHWEGGHRDPSWPNVIALAAALGVKADDFNKKPGNANKRGRGRPKKDQ